MGPLEVAKAATPVPVGHASCWPPRSCAARSVHCAAPDATNHHTGCRTAGSGAWCGCQRGPHGPSPGAGRPWWPSRTVASCSSVAWGRASSAWMTPGSSTSPRARAWALDLGLGASMEEPGPCSAFLGLRRGALRCLGAASWQGLASSARRARGDCASCSCAQLTAGPGLARCLQCTELCW